MGAAARLPKLVRSLASAAPPPVRVPAELCGSAPSLTRHLVLNTSHSHLTWPSHIESVSPLYRELGARWGMTSGFSDLGFAFTDAGFAQGGGAGEKEWDPETPRVETPETSEEERLPGWLYPDFILLPTPLSLSTLPEFESFYRSLGPPRLAANSPARAPPRTHIYVCTHGARDCRCGDLGEPLYEALVREARWRKIGGAMSDGQYGVRIGRVGHIGGHRWAGNALVYKEGGGSDWYGLLRASDAKRLLDVATSASSEPWWPRWRGRLGVTPEEARQQFADKTSADPVLLKTTRKREELPRVPLGDPVPLVFKSWDGEDTYEVNGFEGESLMEVARRHDLPSILATCGGHCECATCHVIISPTYPPVASSPDPTIRAPAALPSRPLLPPVSDEEEDQLEFALGRKPDSRLACQIPITKGLGEWVARGGVISLPRY